MKKYIICPGAVISKNDNQTHWVTSQQLLRLYNVKLSECILIPTGKNIEQYLRGINTRGMTWLYPRDDGNYPDLSV